MIARDAEGYLKNLGDWSETVAEEIALDNGINLSSDHWEIIRLLRRYHQRYQAAPASRALISYVKSELGPDKARSSYLMRLFGGSAARSAARIAGLPKPENCL